ncbi:protocadherin Fat 1-like [Mya arenaria]|uniref:protocadherin Fat 1-like n=1 Tax=Mya arenaria TaxID=6604 RepID=UPI0022E6B6F9|nr:protocadherin Fat 1-like [Mya arenaria]
MTYFAISATDGCVYVRHSLRTNSFLQSEFTMFVRAYDLGTPQRSSAQQATVRITILRNNNCPVFNNLPNQIDISQTQSTLSRIFNVSATDSDAPGRFSTITYSLIGDDNTQVLFNIDGNGFIYVSANNLISNAASMYKLRVRSSDGGFIPCYRDAVLTVNVRGNEFAPFFVPNFLYTVTIMETHNTGQSVVTVQAQDNDIQSPNNLVNYYIASYSANRNMFYMDPTTRNVFLRTSIIGTNVNHYNGTIVYRLDGFVPGTNYFGLKTATGDIYVTNSLALSQINTYQAFTHSAYDSGAPLAKVQETVTITVNRNLNTPIFESQNYEETVYDFEPIGSSVVVLRATDADTISPENVIMYDIAASTQ